VHRVGLAFEEHVKRNLAIDGWAIDTSGGPDVGVDFRASKDTWLLHVQVKLVRRWGVADVSRFVERLPLRQLGPTERYVLAVNSDALSFGSRSFLVAHAIVVWEVPVAGW
jgi:hypothetical protein